MYSFLRNRVFYSMKPRISPAFTRDVPLFLVLIPLINVLNYYLTYEHIALNWRLPVTFLIDTLQGYAAWFSMRLIMQYLDRRYPYHRNPLLRIGIQGLLTSLAAVLVIALLTELVNFLATDTPVPTDFYTHVLFLFWIWALVVNGIYVGLHYYGEFRLVEYERQEGARIRATGFTVQSGRQTVQVPFSEISGFSIDGDYVIVNTTREARYVVTESLDTLEADLPAEWFFRLNRQFIVHREQITGFTRLENGKLSVKLRSRSPFPAETVVSRTKAPSFKRWFEPDTT